MGNNFLREDQVTTNALSLVFQDSGRTILSVDLVYVWLAGLNGSNIQVGIDVDRRSVDLVSARLLPDDLPEQACIKLANKLNEEINIVKFISIQSAAANSQLLYVNQNVFFTDGVLANHLLRSLQFVEYYASDFDIRPFIG